MWIRNKNLIKLKKLLIELIQMNSVSIQKLNVYFV
jgi:spore coat protein CotF